MEFFDNGKYSIARAQKDIDYSRLEKITVPGGQYAVFTTEKGGYAGTELPRLHELVFLIPGCPTLSTKSKKNL